MSQAHVESKISKRSRQVEREELLTDCYHGLEFAPTTLESLVTWDVSGHAQRERERLNAAYRRRE